MVHQPWRTKPQGMKTFDIPAIRNIGGHIRRRLTNDKHPADCHNSGGTFRGNARWSKGTRHGNIEVFAITRVMAHVLRFASDHLAAIIDTQAQRGPFNLGSSSHPHFDQDPRHIRPTGGNRKPRKPSPGSQINS